MTIDEIKFYWWRLNHQVDIHVMDKGLDKIHKLAFLNCSNVKQGYYWMCIRTVNLSNEVQYSGSHHDLLNTILLEQWVPATHCKILLHTKREYTISIPACAISIWKGAALGLRSWKMRSNCCCRFAPSPAHSFWAQPWCIYTLTGLRAHTAALGQGK